MTTIRCGTHGTQDETIVCTHIVESLKDAEPRGFSWNVSDGVFEALCEACNNLSEAEFAARRDEIVARLCFGCFQDAAALNGVDIV